MRLEFLTPDDGRWPAFLRTVAHDFYHRAEYARLAARHDGGQAEAVLVTARENYFFVPYVLRSLAGIDGLGGRADHLHDLVSPYGYPGPLAHEGEAGFVQTAVSQWFRAMQERGVVSGFLRLHPLWAGPAAAVGRVTRRGTTLSIDLTQTAEAVWRGVRLNHQRNITRLQRRGFAVTVEHGAGPLAEFAAIYRETMDRVGAAGFYHFSVSYLEDLGAALGEDLWVCTARAPDGAAVAGLLLVECGPLAHYHLGGTRTAALALAPNKLLVDHAWRWAQARGCRVLHLGGGVGGAEDSLFHFKAGFTDRRHEFCTWELVFQDETYQALEACRRAAGCPDFRPGFFPAYRA